MANMINGYPSQYNLSNTGINQQQLDNTINKSKEAVNTTVESNALLSSSMGIDKESVLLAAPLTAAILFINNVLMAGKEEKSLLGKLAKMGDKISDSFHLQNFGKTFGAKIKKFKDGRFAKYFGDSYKAIPKNQMGKAVKMSEKYADALVEMLGAKAKKMGKTLAVTKESPVDDIIKAADDFLKTNKSKNIEGLRNMLKAADSKVGKTGLGKALAKGGLKFKEIGFSTSDFLSKNKASLGMDIFSIIYFANVLKTAVKETKEAPKGEKLSTFAHIVFADWAPLMVMQPATKLAYKLGGNKYRGMTVEARKKLADIVKAANADKNITAEALKMANLQKKLLLKGGSATQAENLAKKGLEEAAKYVKNFKGKLDLKWWEKPLKAAGQFLASSLDDIKGATTLQKIGKKAKGFGSGAMRFVLILFVLQPLLQKPLTKLGHMIFGKPETYLKKQKEQEKSQENTPTTSVEPQSSNPNQGIVTPRTTNLVEQYSTNLNSQQNNNINQSGNVAGTLQAPYPIGYTQVQTQVGYPPYIPGYPPVNMPVYPQVNVAPHPNMVAMPQVAPQIMPQVTTQVTTQVAPQPASQNAQQSPNANTPLNSSNAPVANNTADPSAALNISKKNDKQGYIPSTEVDIVDNSEKENELRAQELLKRADSNLSRLRKKGF